MVLCDGGLWKACLRGGRLLAMCMADIVVKAALR